MTVNHDVVGSSPTGGVQIKGAPISVPFFTSIRITKHLQKKQRLCRCFLKTVEYKYAKFDKEQKKGYKQSARNLANWYYNDKEDSYTYPDDWCYSFYHIKYQKTQAEFQQEIKVYYADEHESAPQKGLYMTE